MRKISLFDVFKGYRNNKGRVRKIRSLGHVSYDGEVGIWELYIDVLEEPYLLHPETNIMKKHDYLICYEDLSKKDLQVAGVGYLLQGKNNGLIQIKWDFYHTPHIYVNLSFDKLISEIERNISSQGTNLDNV